MVHRKQARLWRHAGPRPAARPSSIPVVSGYPHRFHSLSCRGGVIGHYVAVRMHYMGALAAVVGLATGCGGSSDPRPSPSPTPVSSASWPSRPASPSVSAPRTGPLTTGPNVQPGEKPPVLPAEALQHTASGARIFGVYFVKALDWSIATTDPYLLRPIASPSCKACSRYVTDLASLQAEGGYIRGGRIRLRSYLLSSNRNDPTAEYKLAVRLTQEPDVVVRPSVSPSTDNAQPISYESNIFLAWDRSAWRVVELEAQ